MELINIFNAPICEFETIDSTNEYAKKFSKQNPKHGTIIISKNQTNGKGRFGNSWDSKNENGIYYSIILKMNSKNINYETLPLFVCIGITKLFEEYKTSPKIKWPNDILINEKKVCGILCESTKNSHGEFLIIGIGINLLQDENDFPPQIKHKATSLKQNTNIPIIKNNFINRLTQYLFEYYNLFLNKPFKEFIPYYENKSYILNKQISLTLNNENIFGVVCGFNEFGHLILNSKNKIISINSGEVSLKNAYKNSEHK